MSEETASGVPLVGSRISLISKKSIRYEGILYNINTTDASLALQNGESRFRLQIEVASLPSVCVCPSRQDRTGYVSRYCYRYSCTLCGDFHCLWHLDVVLRSFYWHILDARNYTCRGNNLHPATQTPATPSLSGCLCYIVGPAAASTRSARDSVATLPAARPKMEFTVIRLVFYQEMVTSTTPRAFFFRLWCLLPRIPLDERGRPRPAVRSFGTECRVEGNVIPPSRVLHDFVCFRGQDIMDLHVHDVETEQVCNVGAAIASNKQQHFELPGRCRGSQARQGLLWCRRSSYAGLDRVNMDAAVLRVGGV